MVMEHEITQRCLKRPSWTAILIGALVGVGISFLLSLFSVAIGLSAYTMQGNVAHLAIGGLIGVAIGTIVSTFVGGWTAGYLGRPYCLKKNHGVLYGFSAWCVALLIVIFMGGHAVKYVAAYTNFIANPASATAAMTNSQNMQTASASNAATQPGTDQSVSAAKTLSVSAFVVFVLFFLGAFFSSLGGYFGMRHCCKNDDSCARHEHTTV